MYTPFQVVIFVDKVVNVFLVYHSYFIWQFCYGCNYYPLNLGFLIPIQLLSQQYNRFRFRKYIWWHIPVHAIFAVFCLFFLPVLSRPSKTPNNHQKTDQLFCFGSFKSYNLETSMTCVVTTSVHAIHKHSQKVPRTKSGIFSGADPEGGHNNKHVQSACAKSRPYPQKSINYASYLLWSPAFKLWNVPFRQSFELLSRAWYGL